MSEKAITRLPQMIVRGDGDIFERLYRHISANPMLSPAEKFGLEREVRQIEMILENGELDQHGRNLLLSHVRNLRRLSPSTAEIFLSFLVKRPLIQEQLRKEMQNYLPSMDEMPLL